MAYGGPPQLPPRRQIPRPMPENGPLIGKPPRVQKNDCICSLALSGTCPKTSDTCSSYHPPYRTQFVWQYKSLSDDSWNCYDKSENELLENEYCDPHKTTGQVQCDGLIVYDFNEMKATRYFSNFDERRDTIRRIETGGKFRSPWEYYWLNNQNVWKRFFRKNDNGISGAEIDQFFHSVAFNEQKLKSFSIKGQEFFLHIKRKSPQEWEMFETDSNLKMRSKVTRRPRKQKPVIS